jgi:hypothetical protein
MLTVTSHRLSGREVSVREKGLRAQLLKALDDARLSGEIRLRAGVRIDVGCCDEVLDDAVAAGCRYNEDRCSRTSRRWPPSWHCSRNPRRTGSWRGPAEYWITCTSSKPGRANRLVPGGVAGAE